jgi:ribosomal protein L37E
MKTYEAQIWDEEEKAWRIPVERVVFYSEAMEEIALLNPCGHTGYESVSCDICGYPDSRKLIAKLKAKLSRWEKLMPGMLEE